MDARVKRAIESAEPGKVNTKLWALVIATIEANETKYDQTAFGDKKPSCKSPCCQAGWAAFLVDGKVNQGDVQYRAMDVLGLSAAQARECFHAGFGGIFTPTVVWATAQTIRASVNEWLETQGYRPLSKVKAVQLAAPAGKGKGK